MATAATVETARLESWPDEEIVRRILGGDSALYEVLMRRYNQRLYRVARSVLRDDAEAEDVMQEAYVRAFQHLGQWEGRAKFSTWLTRIAVHEALARAERRRKYVEVSAEDEQAGGTHMMARDHTPEHQVSNGELKRLLETAILGLPERYRLVLMMRDVEEMTTADAAVVLGLSEENVKVRLFRARAMVRKRLYSLTGGTSVQAFEFGAWRCDRVVARVLERLSLH